MFTYLFGKAGSYDRNQRVTAYLMMAPALLLLTVFLITPFIMAFTLSFTNQPLVPRLIQVTDSETGQTTYEHEAPDNVGMQNYSDLLRLQVFVMEPLRDPQTNALLLGESGEPQYERSRTYLRPEGLQELVQFDLFGTHYLIGARDPVFFRSLWNILTFVVIVLPTQGGFALLLAMLVNQKIAGTAVYRTIYFSPVVTSMAVIAVVWFFLYNPSQGLLNTFLRIFNLGPFDWLAHPSSAMVAIIIMSIWQGVGFQMIIFLAGLKEISEELYEASALDGANIWQQFRFVTLPNLRNTIIFVSISTTVLAFKLFVQVDVMTFGRGGPDNATITPVLHMVNQGFRSTQQIGYASAIAVVFVIIVLIVSLLQRRLLTERVES